MSWLRRYIQLCHDFPQRILAVASIVTALLCLFSFPALDFSSDRRALFKISADEQAKQQAFQKRFGSWDQLVIVLDGGSSKAREKAALALRDRLQDQAEITDLRACLEMEDVHRISLYFLSVQELTEVRESLQIHGQRLAGLSREGWYSFLERSDEIDQLDESQSAQRERFKQVWEENVQSRGKGALKELFPRVEFPSRFFFTDGETRHLLFLRSQEPIRVQEIVDQMSPNLGFPGRVVLTGQPLLQALEKQQTIRDALLTTAITIVLVQFILTFGFQEKARPRFGFLSLILGLLWSTAWAALSVGTLNIITINFLCISVGLGVDFSIHILARYSEERNREKAVPAMVETMRTTGVENLIGAAATSLAFASLYLTEFQAVRELGLITGLAVPICFVSVVTLYPPMLFWWERKHPPNDREVLTYPSLSEAERLLRGHPHKAALVGLLATIAMVFWGRGVRFDSNLLNMQAPSARAVSYEREASFNSLSAFVTADTPEHALVLKEKLEQLPSVSRVQTIAELFPSNVREKRTLVQDIVELSAKIPIPLYNPKAVPDWDRLKTLTAESKAGDKAELAWVAELKDVGPGPVEDIWVSMQSHLKIELTRFLKILKDQDPNLSLTDWRNKHPQLINYSNLDGKTVLRIQAKGDLWQRSVMDRFVTEIQSVTDRGLGPPFSIRSYLDELHRSYVQAVGYAMMAILVLLAVHFRAVLPTLIALTPKLVGAAAMFWAMAIFGIDLNPANCLALPLTLGIGLVFGIHAVHRSLENPDFYLVHGSTGRAIALSGLTTVTSFGTLMVATHPGIFSLGFVMATGVGANMLATYFFVPPLIELSRSRL